MKGPSGQFSVPRNFLTGSVFQIVVMRYRIYFLFVLFSIPLTAQEQKGSRFDGWDRNGDGKLAKEELPPGLRKNFSRIDKDGNGFISRQEDAEVAKREKGASGRRRRAQLPEGVKKIADLDYAGTDNPRQKLDLYLPKKPVSEGLLPVIAFIHGGGWKNGDKSSGGSRLIPLVASGRYAAVSIGYRLSDEAQWPSQIHDCKAGIRWIRANADKYRLDAGKLAVWGTSAGGHLVAMLGVSHGVKGLEGDIGPYTKQSSEVSCVVDFFGPTDLLNMDNPLGTMDHNAPDSPESKLIGGAVQEHKKKARNASPLTYVSADDAPFLIAHGDKDPLVNYSQSVRFAKKLRAAGVPVVLITVQGGGHGRGFGPEVTQSVKDFLNVQLWGAKKTISDKTVKSDS